MTIDEAQKVARAVECALAHGHGTGCESCCGAAVNFLNDSFPEFEWSYREDPKDRSCNVIDVEQN